VLGDVPSKPVTFVENGVQFRADVVVGQKTGFFLDQRDNRQRMQVCACTCNCTYALHIDRKGSE
jgi:23S rRNA G2069 N7-methylase RlmK/C1962 C5-methylase RlmI